MARSKTANRRLASRRNGSFRSGFRPGYKDTSMQDKVKDIFGKQAEIYDPMAGGEQEYENPFKRFKTPGTIGGSFDGETDPGGPIIPEAKKPFGEGQDPTEFDPVNPKGDVYNQRQVSACLRQQLNAGVPLSKAEDRCKGR